MPDDLVEERLSTDEQEFVDSLDDYIQRCFQPIADMVMRLATRLDAVEKNQTGLRYREVWHDDANYRKGDVVTFSGSAWTAIAETPAGRPGSEASGWKLMVKRGAAGAAGRDHSEEIRALEARIRALEATR